jgi:FtsP/CotA-like multicopper oxidase with cupredoxin domain
MATSDIQDPFGRIFSRAHSYMNDTVNIAPGERWDVIVDCTEPGTFAFRCHILSHVESDHGMFGMVTALVVEA